MQQVEYIKTFQFLCTASDGIPLYLIEVRNNGVAYLTIGCKCPAFKRGACEHLVHGYRNVDMRTFSSALTDQAHNVAVVLYMGSNLYIAPLRIRAIEDSLWEVSFSKEWADGEIEDIGLIYANEPFGLLRTMTIDFLQTIPYVVPNLMCEASFHSSPRLKASNYQNAILTAEQVANFGETLEDLNCRECKNLLVPPDFDDSKKMIQGG